MIKIIFFKFAEQEQRPYLLLMSQFGSAQTSAYQSAPFQIFSTESWAFHYFVMNKKQDGVKAWRIANGIHAKRSCITLCLNSQNWISALRDRYPGYFSNILHSDLSRVAGLHFPALS